MVDFKELEKTDFSEAYEAIKTCVKSCLPAGYPDTDWIYFRNEIIAGAYILLRCQENPAIRDLDDIYKNWSYHTAAGQPISCDSAIMAIDSSYGQFFEDGWEKLMVLKGEFSNKSLMALILFSGIHQAQPISNSNIYFLVSSLMDISNGSKIADFSAGDGEFVLDMTRYYPNLGFDIYSDKEDIWGALFPRFTISETCLGNDLGEGLFNIEILERKYDAILFDCNCRSGKDYVEPQLQEELNKLCGFDTSECSQEWLYCILMTQCLKENKKGVAIMPLSCMTNIKDKNARNWLVENGYISCSILLPDNLYGNTSAAFILLVISSQNDAISMIDASELYDEYHVGGKKKKNVSTEDYTSKISEAWQYSTDISQIISIEDVLKKESILDPMKYLDEVVITDSFDLGDVLYDVNRGIQLKGEQLDALYTDTDTGLCYLAPGHINDGMISGRFRHVNFQNERRNKFIADELDILLSKSGVPFKVTIIPHNEQFLVSGNFFILRVDTEKINPFFLTAYLLSKKGQSAIRQVSSSGVLPNLSKSAVKKILIPKTDKETQDKIAEEFIDLSNKIINTKLELNTLIEDRNHLF